MPSSSKKADEEYQPPDPKDQTPQGLKEQAADQEVNVRRSSRANKGVARPIFDPSDLPSESGGHGNRSLSKKEIDPIVFELDTSDEFNDNLEFSKVTKKRKSYKPRVSKGKKETVSKAVVEIEDTEVTKSSPAPLEDSFSDEDNLPLTILKASTPASTTKSAAKFTSTPKSTTKKRKKKEQAEEEEEVEVEEGVEEPPATSSNIPSLELSPFKAQFGKLPAKEENDSEEIDEERLLPTEKLQCICKKTHTNRLLVLCDKCDCWLHGDCVGLSTQRARNIEDKGEIYTCPNCSPAQRKIQNSEMPRDSQSGKSTGGFSMKGYALKGTITNPSSSSEAQHNVADDKKRIKFYRIPKKKKKVIKKPTKKVIKKPTKKELKKGGEGSKRSARLRKRDANKSNNNNETSKSTSGESSRRKCTVPTCDKDALPGTVYCSNTCILEHARLSSHHLKQPSATASSEVIKPKYSVPKNESSNKLEPQMLISPLSPHQVSPKKRLKDNKIMVRSRKTGKVIGRVVFDKEDEEYTARKVNRRSSSGGEDFAETAPPSTSSARNSSSGGDGVVKRKKMKKPESAAPLKAAAPAPPKLDKQPGVFDFINHHVMKRERVNRMRLAHDQVTIPAASKVIRKAEKRVSGSSSKEVGGKSSKKTKLTFEEQLLNTSAQAVTAQRKIAKQQKMEKMKKAKAREQKARMEGGSSGKVAGHKSVAAAAAVEKRTAPSTSHDSRQQHRPITATDSVKPARLDSVRGNVRKTLNDILKNRSASTKELRMHPDSIQRLADKIEDSLYKVFSDTNVKYKNKYRSIMFNLKDEKNPGLWRKVIIGEVTSAELVQMTAEQMASRKLAEWRQQKMTEELDIIQKQEKERAKSRPTAKITHKGEIAIQEDLSDMIHNIVNPADATKDGNAAVDGGKEETPDPSSTIDTTSDHRNHLFDFHCNICTGGIKEEDMENQEEQPPTVVKSSTAIILCSEAQTRSESVSSEQGMTVEKSKISVASLSDDTEVDEVFGGGGETPTMDEIGSPINMPDSPVNMPESPDTEIEEEASEMPKAAIVYEQEAVTSPKIAVVAALPAAVTSFVSVPAAVKPTTEDVIWRGIVSMNELSPFTANVYPVCGDCTDLNLHLPSSLEIGGRIVQSVAWKYLQDVKVTRSKQISVVRFHAASHAEMKAYINMMGYFSKRKRFGVLGNPDRTILKDMYLIPMMSDEALPQELIDLTDGEITESLSPKLSLIIGVIVRNRTKNYRDIEVSSPNLKTSPRAAATSSPNIVENTTKSKVLSLIDSVRQIPSAAAAQQEQYSPTKQSGVTLKRTAGQGYIPSTIATTVPPSGEDLDVAYDPDDEEEYDPETAFSSTADVSESKDSDDRPYDPEEEEERLMNAELNEAEAERKRNELLADIRREIDAKAAKLAQVNEEMKQSEDVEEAEGNEAPNDPRLARRTSTETAQVATATAPGNHLQTILSALKIPPTTGAVTDQQEVVAMDTASPPQLPDSTTKSDPEEIGEPFVTKQTNQTRVIDNEEDEDSADFRNETSNRRNSGDLDLRNNNRHQQRNHRDHGDQRRHQQDHRNNHHHRSHKRNRSRSRSPSYRRRNNDHHSSRSSSRRDGDRHQSREDRGRY